VQSTGMYATPSHALQLLFSIFNNLGQSYL